MQIPLQQRDLMLGNEFLRRLESLAVSAGRIFATGGVASRPGSIRGGRIEFLDHRGYVEGDDLRDLDWNVYARTDEAFVKVFGAEREKHVYILLDLSRSMAAHPGKEVFACRLAGALAHVALAAGDTVHLIPMAAASPEPPPRKGMRASREIIRRLEHIAVSAPIDWEREAARYVSTPRSAGTAVIISDFWAEAVIKSLSPLNRLRQEITLLQVLTPEEISPPMGGNVRLEDSETGMEVSLSLTQRDLDAYGKAVENHLSALRDGARRHGMKHILCRTDMPFEQVVLNWLRSGGLLR